MSNQYGPDSKFNIQYSIFNIQFQMAVIITLFYLSLATIIVMVSWKLVTLRELKLSLIEGSEKEIHGKLFEMIHYVWRIFRVNVLSRIRTFTLALFYTIAHEVLRFVGIVGQKLKTRHSKWFDMVEGKGVLRKKGSVSFFLRDMAEYKKSIKGK